MNRFANSWEVAKQSWAVLRANPSLAIFPVISAIGTVLVSIPFLVPVILVAIGKGQHIPVMGPLGYLLGFLMYAATYSVVVFFNSALVTCAYQNLRGEPATPTDGIRNAIKHLPQILGWALIAATVGQLIRAVQERAGIVGALLGGLVGLAWNVTVFFVVPLIVLENLGPVDALKASAARLKRTWGEQLILNGGMGLVSFLVVFFPMMAFVALAVMCFAANLIVPGIVLIGVGVVFMMSALVILSCLTTIYQTALYVYSSTGALPYGYSETTIQGAFTQKKPMFGGPIGR